MHCTGDESSGWQYYIHYLDFNRRMDEWVPVDRIVKLPSEANAIGIETAAAAHVKSHAPTTAPSSSSSMSVAASSKTAKSSSKGKRQDSESSGTSETSMDVISLREDDDQSMDVSPADAEADEVDDENGAGDQDAEEGQYDNDSERPTRIIDLEHDEHEGMDEAALLEHEEVTKVKNIKTVQLGKYVMECWYFSPFPREYYLNGPTECLYFCEFTLRFFRTKAELHRFQSAKFFNAAVSTATMGTGKPPPGPTVFPRHPPGNEIYRDEHVSMFELDGAVEKVYCQNLCYFAKLFLDHKTLYWDVDPFLFYVLTSHDDRGYHPVGFFSKEK